MHDRRSGFTLIELLIVTVLIGLLAAIAVPKFASSKERAYDATAVGDLRNLITMSEAYFADYLEYPEDIDQLDYNASPGTVVSRFRRETTDGHRVVHIHIHHEGSPHYFHVEYPVEQIEMRDRS